MDYVLAVTSQDPWWMAWGSLLLRTWALFQSVDPRPVSLERLRVTQIPGVTSAEAQNRDVIM